MVNCWTADQVDVCELNVGLQVIFMNTWWFLLNWTGFSRVSCMWTGTYVVRCRDFYVALLCMPSEYPSLDHCYHPCQWLHCRILLEQGCRFVGQLNIDACAWTVTAFLWLVYCLVEVCNVASLNFDLVLQGHCRMVSFCCLQLVVLLLTVTMPCCSAGLTVGCIQKCIKLCGLLQNHECQLMCHALFVIHVLHGAAMMALVAGLFNALTLYAQFAHDSGEVRLVYIALYVALIYAIMCLLINVWMVL